MYWYKVWEWKIVVVVMGCAYEFTVNHVGMFKEQEVICTSVCTC